MAHRLRKIGLAVERQRALQVRDEDGAILGDYFAEPFAKFARKRDLLSGRVVVPGKPMASQVQIPFEGVILQEHSAPISCPTPSFAKGSADLFVENCLILELKACKALMSEHVAQVLGYLRASGQRDAMLINFGSSRLEIKKFVL